MMVVTATDDNPFFKKLSENIKGHTGIFIFDEDVGTIAALIEKGAGYEMTDISEVTRKDAPVPAVRAIKE
jgi:hypothetical protein